MILRHGVAGQAGPEGMIDPRAAQRGVLLEEALRHRAWFEHAHPRLQPVLASIVGELLQVLEVGVEVERRPEPPGERRIHKMVKAGRVGVELRIIFPGDEVLVGHVHLEAVDLDMGEPGLGQRGDVVLGVETAGAAPVAGVTGVPVRAIPAEGRRQQEPGGEFLAGQRAEAHAMRREQPDGGEQEGAVRGEDFTVSFFVDAQPDPGGFSGGGRREVEGLQAFRRGHCDANTARG